MGQHAPRNESILPSATSEHARKRRAIHVANTGLHQRIRSGTQCRTSCINVVYEQQIGRWRRARQYVEPLRNVYVALETVELALVACFRTTEHGKARLAEFVGNHTRQKLSMVETALAVCGFCSGNERNRIDAPFRREYEAHESRHDICKPSFALVLVNARYPTRTLIEFDSTHASHKGQAGPPETSEHDVVALAALDAAKGSTAPRTRPPPIDMDKLLKTAVAQHETQTVAHGTACRPERFGRHLARQHQRFVKFVRYRCHAPTIPKHCYTRVDESSTANPHLATLLALERNAHYAHRCEMRTEDYEMHRRLSENDREGCKASERNLPQTPDCETLQAYSSTAASGSDCCSMSEKSSTRIAMECLMGFHSAFLTRATSAIGM